jgi:putative transposase
VRFAFIAGEKAAFPVRLLCRTLHVSRAGFYAWQARPPGPRARADARLGLEVAAIHAKSRQRYGSPRILAELRARGGRASRKRVARLMRARGLAARRRRRFRVTTHARHPFPIAPNVLARQFARAVPNHAWVTDRHHLHPDSGGLAVPGGDPRSLELEEAEGGDQEGGAIAHRRGAFAPAFCAASRGRDLGVPGCHGG